MDGKKLYLYPVADNSTQPVILDGTEEIRALTFAYSKMKQIRIPASVTSLEGGVFYECRQLKKVIFEKGSLCRNTQRLWGMDDNVYGAFQKCTALKKIAFGDCFEKMHTSTFEGCSSLKKISFGRAFAGTYTYENIDSADKDSASNEPIYEPCYPSLEAVSVSAENKTFKTEEGVLYSKDGSILYECPVSKNQRQFIVPDTVREIQTNAFYGNKYVERVIMGRNVQTIGVSAFCGCGRLSEVVLDQGVSLSEDSFYDCASLKKVKGLAGIRKIEMGAFGGDTPVFFLRRDYVKAGKRKNYVSWGQTKHYIVWGRTKKLMLPRKEKNVSWEIVKGEEHGEITKKTDRYAIVCFKKKKANSSFKIKVKAGTETFVKNSIFKNH